jgi:hypothetical protein
MLWGKPTESQWGHAEGMNDSTLQGKAEELGKVRERPCHSRFKDDQSMLPR